MLYGDFVICKDKDSGALYYDYNNVYTGQWQANEYRMRGMTSSLPNVSYNEDRNYYTTHNLDVLKYVVMDASLRGEEDSLTVAAIAIQVPMVIELGAEGVGLGVKIGSGTWNLHHFIDKIFELSKKGAIDR